MEHIAQESLVDFVRHRLPPAETALVNRHIAECGECSCALGLYGAVARMGANDAAYEPPEGIIRTVKAHFDAEQRRAAAAPKGALELLFDSLAQPLAAGVRASVASARQLLYRVGTLYVDMRVDSELNSERAALVGQMLDSAHPGPPVSAVPVIRRDGRKSVASTMRNSNGEF